MLILLHRLTDPQRFPVCSDQGCWPSTFQCVFPTGSSTLRFASREIPVFQSDRGCESRKMQLTRKEEKTVSLAYCCCGSSEGSNVRSDGSMRLCWRERRRSLSETHTLRTLRKLMKKVRVVERQRTVGTPRATFILLTSPLERDLSWRMWNNNITKRKIQSPLYCIVVSKSLSIITDHHYSLDYIYSIS